MTHKAFEFGQEVDDPQNNCHSPERSRIHVKN